MKKLTITCKHCLKEFQVSAPKSEKTFCSKTCESKFDVEQQIKKCSVCVVCHTKFWHYGEQIFCSRVCNAKYLSHKAIASVETTSEKNECANCGTVFPAAGQRKYCSLACCHQVTGVEEEKSKSYKELKASVRQRDESECQLCGLKESLHIHHIDNNKDNLDKDNLVTLCLGCRRKAEKETFFWQTILTGLISSSKVVKKPWGLEIHIANHNDYCLKYLVFYQNKQFSYHFHDLKKELWHCLCGEFECVLTNDDRTDYLIFKAGQKIEIERGVIHQLQARKNSILVEVSTKDFPEDSIRVVEGKN